MQPDVCGGDLVIATGAIRFEGTTKENAPIDYPAIANYDIIHALKESADELGLPDSQVHDTDRAARVAVEAVRKLIL